MASVKKTKVKEESAFDKLSDKHKLFVMNYVGCFGNATKAYMKTYPNAKYDTARSKGSELVAKDNVKLAVEEKYQEVYSEIQTESEKAKTYQLIKNLSEFTIDDIINMKDGTLIVKSIDDIPEEARHLIQGLTYDRCGNIRVQLVNRVSALKMRAELQGLLEKDENRQTVEIIVKGAERPQ